MRILLLTLLCFFACTSGVRASSGYETFASLPVLHEGRLQPLESFARAQLYKLSSHTDLDGQAADAWLADVIFDPGGAADKAVFALDNEVLRERLGIEKPRGALYTLAELEPLLSETRSEIAALLAAEEQGNLSAAQTALLALHEKSVTYLKLMRSLSLILPLNVEVPDRYGVTKGDVTFLDLVRQETRAIDDLKSIVADKGDDPAQYSAQQRAIAALAFQLQQIRGGAAGNALFKIMPLSWQGGQQVEFLAPWELLLRGQGSPENAAYLKRWQAMASAYRAGDMNAFSDASTAAKNHVRQRLGAAYPALQFTLERIYDALQPYNWAVFLYAASLIFAALYALYVSNVWVILSRAALAGGALFHAGGIGLRMAILERPPVGTLYESVLFVALVCALIGLVLAFKRGGVAYNFAGAFAALGLLLVAPTIISGAETLGVLSAVLNTNFWLGTHVLCITIGYGVAVMTALFAHFALFTRAFPKLLAARPDFDKLITITYRISLAALLFTAVGTILGGIWADQSWGRFWGWDPKENGALLIVLWLLWLQHGRLSGHIKSVPFAAGMAFMNVILALAWFGVNLLGVGLHSYGFTEGLAWGLGLFCGAQSLLIIVLWGYIWRRERSRP